MFIICWFIYLLCAIASYHWLLTTTQVLYIIEIGLKILFIRKIGVYSIRFCKNSFYKLCQLLQLQNYRQLEKKL